MMKQCYSCKQERNIPGDCHISCSNPPEKEMGIGAGGEERYEIAEKLAGENGAVVRCVWPGSGIYPICFDGNTVFGCSNYEEEG